MRIIFKIITAPFVLVLTIVVSFLYFILSVGDWLFALAGGALAIMGVISWAWGGRMTDGIALLIMGFLVSPFGIPRVALWIVEKLHDLKDNLRSI